MIKLQWSRWVMMTLVLGMGSQLKAEEVPLPIMEPASYFENVQAEDVITPVGFSCNEDPCGEGCCPLPGGDGCGIGCCNSGCDSGCFLFSDEPLLSGLKNMQIGCSDWTLSVGGSLRYRYMDEQNRLRPTGGNPNNSEYNLWRFDPGVTLKYKDRVTFFAEMIDASQFNEEIQTLPIDVNRWDLQRLYVDLKVAELENGTLRYRYGRDYLKFGNQHLLSPLAWANTYRNFQGHKLYYQGADWNIDAFAMQSVNGASGGQFRPNNGDRVDQSRWISGIYGTKKKFVGGSLDAYWLWSLEQEPNPARQDGDRHTFGLRYYGSKPVKECGDVVRTWAWDVDGGLQLGDDTFGMQTTDVYAGFFGAKVGHTWNKATWTPNVTGLFWYGSGDGDPGTGNNKTYFSLYPLGHAYWGIIDQFSGQNLIDYSVQASVKPTKKLTLAGQFHVFHKAEEEDQIYNIAGVGLGPTGGNDRHIGNELDLIGTYAFNKNTNLQIGYQWFWYGGAVSNTALARPDAKQLYIQALYKF